MAGCAAKRINIECTKPIKPECKPVVEEFESMISESQPRLRMPEPHEVVDMIECVNLLKAAYD